MRFTVLSSATSEISLEPLEQRRLLSSGIAIVAQKNLVSDGFVAAAHVDSNLKNPWGVAFSPGGAFWVANNNSGTAGLYDGTGASVPSLPFITVPGGGGGAGNPTGQVFNPGTGFNVQKDNGAPGSSKFIFVGEDGGISGWSPSVDSTHAVLAVDNSATGAVYKGATLAQVGRKTELFVTNFNSGAVEVYNDTFSRVQLSRGFQDKSIPAGFAPFNIQNIGGLLYVTYAKQNAAKHDDVGGPGNGYIDVYNVQGKLRSRLQHGSFLSSPWGVTKAPKSWGRFAGDILVGQFKSGNIDIFNPRNGRFAGFVSDANKAPVQIDGLWAITPGTGSATGSTQDIFFTAGVNEEQGGLFGSLSFLTASKQSLTGAGGVY